MSKIAFITSGILVFNWVLSFIVFSIAVVTPVAFSASFLVVSTIAVVNDIIMLGVFFKRNEKFPYIFNPQDDQIFISSSAEDKSDKEALKNEKSNEEVVEMQLENQQKEEN